MDLPRKTFHKKPLATWGLAGLCLVSASVVVFLTLVLFVIDYNFTNAIFPIYKLLAYPGIFFLRFFSEELDFYQKLGVLSVGQFFAYAAFFYAVIKLWVVLHTDKNE